MITNCGVGHFPQGRQPSGCVIVSRHQTNMSTIARRCYLFMYLFIQIPNY